MTSELFLRKVSTSPQRDMNYLILQMTFLYSLFLSDPVKQHPSLLARPQFVAGRAVIVPTTLQRCATGQEEVL